MDPDEVAQARLKIEEHIELLRKLEQEKQSATPERRARLDSLIETVVQDIRRLDDLLPHP